MSNNINDIVRFIPGKSPDESELEGYMQNRGPINSNITIQDIMGNDANRGINWSLLDTPKPQQSNINMTSILQNMNKASIAMKTAMDAKNGKTNYLGMSQLGQPKSKISDVGSAVDTTVNILDSIASMTSHKREPINEKIGYAEGGYVNKFDGISGSSMMEQGGGNSKVNNYMATANTAMSLVGNAIQQSQIADTSNVKSGIRAAQANYSGANDFDSLMNAYNNTARLNTISYRDLRGNSYSQDILNGVSAGNQGAQAGFNIGGGIGAVVGGIFGTASSIWGSLSGRHKAKREAKRINKAIKYTNNYNDRAFTNQADYLASEQLEDIYSNINAYGGPINMKYSGTMSPFGNRHNFGGTLNTHGGDFSQGFVIIKNGGTHEQNPNEGVQMGVDPQGIPNLVEEGEVVYNDYVFSNRLKITDKILKDYRIPSKKKDCTFAEVAEDLTKEIKDRPNDTISHNSLRDSLGKLKEAQEELKAKREERRAKKQIMQAMEQEAMMQELANSQMMQETPEEMQEAPAEEVPQEEPEDTVDSSAMMGYAYGGKLGEKGNLFAKGDKLVFNDKAFADKELFLEDELNSSKPSLGLAKTFTDGLITNDGLIDSRRLSDTNNLIESITQRPIDYSFKDDNGTVLNNDIRNLKFGRTPLETTIDNNRPTWMRYAPVLGAAVGVTQNLLSKPDYTTADRIEKAAQQARDYQSVKYEPLGDYLTYRPLDRLYATNMLNAAAGASRRALLNTSSGNRASAAASILAADNNYMNQIGSLFRQAEESNQAQRERAATFNKDTNKTNSQGKLQADIANQNARQAGANAYLSGIEQAMNIRQNIDAQRAASLNANMTNLFDSIGNIGRENYSMNQFDMLANAGYFGILRSKPQGWSNKQWADYKKQVVAEYNKNKAMKDKTAAEVRAENERKRQHELRMEKERNKLIASSQQAASDKTKMAELEKLVKEKDAEIAKLKKR